MEYRIRELNGRFSIQAKRKDYDLYWWFGWKKKNEVELWIRVNTLGFPNPSPSRHSYLFNRNIMKSFKSLKKAEQRIKELRVEPKYHKVK